MKSEYTRKIHQYDYSEVKTQNIYFLPMQFKRYSIEYIEYEKIEAEPEYIHEIGCMYVVGNEPVGLQARKDVRASSYEDIISTHVKYSDSALLESLLTLGRKFVNISLNKKGFETIVVPLVFKFCERYGLPEDVLLDMQSRAWMQWHFSGGKKGQKPQSPFSLGFNLWHFFCEARMLYLDNERIVNMLNGVNQNNIQEDLAARNTRPSITFQSAICSGGQGVRTVFISGSLVDIARYQLGVAVSARVLIKKCENPKCNEMIVGGRANKKTCSDACRKAVQRLQQRQPTVKNAKEGAPNGDDPEAR